MLPVIYSERFLQHNTGRFHPERPERLTAIVEALKTDSRANQIEWHLPTPIEKRDIFPLLAKIHAPEYIERVRRIAANGGGLLDGDTPVSPASYDIALLAVSAWLDGVDLVLAEHNPAFVLARPPGHHATPDRGMGFCLFANAAIAADYALQQKGIDRVAILDWDVHHGNGTEAIAAANPQLAYCSLHQHPCYPGTGTNSDRAQYNNILNLPMSAGSTLAEYSQAMEKSVIPFLKNFQADLIIVSAGYDANRDDPLAEICLQPSDYGVLTDYVLSVSRCLLFGLEGGYDLSALARSVVATITSCLC